MNRIGIYYAYWTRDWDVDFIPYVRKVKELGFDILEVNSGTVTAMNRTERDRLRAAAEEHGIELTYCIGLSAEYDVASEEASVRRRGIEFLQKGAEMVHEVGGTTFSGIIYGMWPGMLDERHTSKPSAWRHSVTSMREAAKAAEDYGVVFNVEVVNRFEQFLINTCEEALTYVGEVGSPNVKILLDTFHLNIEEDSIGAAIERAGGKLGHFHIGENNRRPPGYGHIPWGEVASSLQRIGYRGAIVMEPFMVPGGEVGRDIKVFRKLAVGADMDLEAGKALRFIRGKLSS